MVSKRLARQIKKSFGDEDYYSTLPPFINENLSSFNDLQKEKLEPLTNFEDFVNVIEQSYNDDQALLLRAQKNLETSSEELAQTNKDLFKTNKIVEQMLNSLDQGFLIFDKELKCLSIYTKSTVEMLGTEVEGKLIQNILPFDKEERVHSFVDWCELVFLDMHDFETLQALAPKRLIDAKSGKTLDLDFKTVRDADNVLLFMTLILTDRTQEIINQNNANKMQEYAQMVSKVISDKKTTYDYINQIQRLLSELSSLLAIKPVSEESIIGMKRVLHTIKGAGNTYYFGDLGRRINDLELKLNAMDDLNNMNNLIHEEEPVLKSIFETYLKQVNELTSEENKTETISHKTKEWIIETLKKAESKQMTKEDLVDGIYSQFILTPLFDYINPYGMTVKDLAKRLSKPMPKFTVAGENIRIKYENYADFLSELVHIYRNIMDHGLEFEGDRIIRKKPAEGNILTNVNLVDSNGIKSLKITISDDGNGIDPNKIRQKLLQSEKNSTNVNTLTDDQLINQIFGHGFSTAEIKTDVSGQGVGLDALKGAVERLQGSIKVESKVQQGTTFIIELPIKNY